MKEQEDSLVYHTLHGRPMAGCLPLFFILSCLFLGGLLMALKVEMPPRIPPKGEGRVYYRNDDLVHFNLRQRSPLPLNLPDYIDPARQEESAAQVLPTRFSPALQQAPPLRGVSQAPDSCVLDAASLLVLPPDDFASLEPGLPKAEGKEAQP